MYYGTEVLMKGFTNPDGLVRMDFPGGWDDDVKMRLQARGSRTMKSRTATGKTLGNFRKNSSALKTGKMMQYVPQDGLYVYFRYDAKQTIMCVMNASGNVKRSTLANMQTETKVLAKQ